MDMETVFKAITEELYQRRRKTQPSYGPGNISAFGERGCLIRANDKMQRLIRLVWQEVPNPLEDETIEDTWLDLANYAIIALMCRRGHWPGVERKGEECDVLSNR